MVDQPFIRPQPGDELARQQQANPANTSPIPPANTDYLIQQQIQNQQSQIADNQSFANYLRDQRASISQSLTDTINPSQQQTYDVSNLAPGTSPTQVYGEGLQAGEQAYAFEKNAVLAEQSARKRAQEVTNDLISNLLSIQSQQRQERKDNNELMLKYMEMGFAIDPSTGETIPLQDTSMAINDLLENDKDFDKSLSGIQEISNVLNRLESEGIGGKQQTLKEAGLPITGKLVPGLAKFFGLSSGEQQQLSADIGKLADKIRNETFGAQVTELEKKIGSIPDVTKNESENYRVLKRYRDEALALVKNKMVSSGLSPLQASMYLEGRGLPQTIKVKRSSDGQVGYLDSIAEFDDTQYELLEE